MIASWLDWCGNNAGAFFTAASAMFIAELLFPQSKYSLVSKLRGAIFRIAYIPLTATAIILFQRLWGYLGVTPLFDVDLSALSSSTNPVIAGIGGIIAFLIVVQVGEFFYYWFHRAQHKIKFLWLFHAEHHSLEEMSAFNSNHHFSEEIFRIPFITIPMSLLFSFNPGYVPWLFAFLMGWQGIYEHSATKLNFSILRYIVPDNRFHRIHHSMERRHFDKNFGSGSALWDIVFGTAHFPEQDEWPDVGLKTMGQPRTVREYLFRPFHNKRSI